MADLTFNDYKNKLSIIQVALELGYKYDRSKGKSQPSFVLTDGMNKEIDRIYIKNPNNNSIQGYWRRSVGFGKSSGDLIDFVKENISGFPDGLSAKNETQALNIILSRLVNNPVSYDYKTLSIDLDRSKKDFDINRYDRDLDNIRSISSILSNRALSEETALIFSPFLEIIKDKESKFNYKNLAFPYRVPGHDDIAGYEIRGYGGFKGKAPGSNSTNAVWIADFEKNPLMVRNVYYAESGFDIMAFYQINKHKIETNKSVFVSTGGSFSDDQFLETQKYYGASKPVLLFDNDIHGIMYDIRALSLLKGKSLRTSTTNEDITFIMDDKQFSIPMDSLSISAFKAKSGLRSSSADLTIWKAPSPLKDWNDVLLQKKSDEEISNKFDSKLKR